MSGNQTILLLTILLPFAGAVLLPLIGRISPTLRNYASLALIVASFFGVICLFPVVIYGQTVDICLMQSTWFYADKLALLIALVPSLIGSIIIIYSFGYIEHYSNQNEYYFMVVLFLGSMMGLIFSHHLILLFVFWEITSIASWRLIGFYRDTNAVLRADKAFLVTVFGALVMLVGFLLIYDQAGSFDLKKINIALNGQSVSNLAVALILLGIFSKSATLPVHTWLPDAGVAPSPVTALLHAAVLVKIGVYAYARLFVVELPINIEWHTIVPIIAGISAIVSGGAALIEKDIKRIIAYSTVSQLAFILLGLAVNTKVGVGGALLFILMHGIAKGGLFLCAGIVEQKTHEKDITKLGGLISTMPVTALSFLFCSFSAMGIPPFGGFFGKYMIISGTISANHLFISGIFILGSVLTILYLFRVFSLVFLGTSKVIPESSLPLEGSQCMIGSVAFLAALSLVSGIFITYPHRYIWSLVKEITGIF